jgi:transposase
MDMWQPYIAVVEENVYRAHEKICFDKFHVAKHLGDAVNGVLAERSIASCSPTATGPSSDRSTPGSGTRRT